MNGKRKKKRQANGRFVATVKEVQAPPRAPEELTGTFRVMLDNTVPGGIRYEHTPGKAL